MKVEIKVWAAAALSLVASIVVAVLNAVQTNPDLLGSLPVWVQTLILIVVPPVLTWLGGYVKRSNTSTTSLGYRQKDSFITGEVN